jgi:uncharacterized membrane protein YkoI
MNSKRIWQGMVAATLVTAAVGTVALAADTLNGLQTAGGPVLLASIDDRHERDDSDHRGDHDQRQWISMTQALAAVTGAGYHDVREIEREGYGYEAKALDHKGQRWELKLDGRSGEIIARERD